MLNLRYSLISTLLIASTFSLRTLSITAQESTAASTASTTTTAATTTTTTSAQKTFKIYHSLGQTKPFLPRGTITFSTESSNEDSASNSASNNNDITTIVENDESCLGEKAIQDMDELVSGGGFYRIKIVDEENGGMSVLASVPGCEVKRANFREEIALSMSQTGSLLSLSYRPLVSPLASQCHELQPLSSSNREFTFQTLISYTTATPGMVLPKILPKMRPPPGLNVIQIKKGTVPNSNQPNQGAGTGTGTGNARFFAEEEDAKTKQESNQSFFRKYWYVILPVSIMTLFSGADEPPQQQQQKQGQRQSGGTGAGGANPAVINNASTRQRRGKRD